MRYPFIINGNGLISRTHFILFFRHPPLSPSLVFSIIPFGVFFLALLLSLSLSLSKILCLPYSMESGTEQRGLGSVLTVSMHAHKHPQLISSHLNVSKCSV